MLKTLLAATTAMGLALTAAPAFAFDPANLAEGERSALRDEIRAYLIENPEVLMEAFAVLEERQAAAKAADEQTMIKVNAKDIFDDPNSWQGGNIDGDITLVEFVDYRCGYCRKAHDEVARLVETDGNIRLIVKDLPILGEDSLTAARFAIAVKLLNGDDAYKEVHDALIKHKGGIGEKSLTRIGEGAGIDAAAAIAKMGSDEVTAVIAANHQLAGRLQISGTPTFVLQDEMLRGYVPLDGMIELVAQARAKAD